MENEICKACKYELRVIFYDKREEYDVFGTRTESIDLSIFWCANCGSLFLIDHKNEIFESPLMRYNNGIV